MRICSFRHEEIAHEGRDCPLCALADTHSEIFDKLQDEFADRLDAVTDERDYYRSLLEEHNPELLI